MKEYQIGDYVIFFDKEYSKRWKKHYGFSFYNKTAKIIQITGQYIYLLKFEKLINQYWFEEKRFKLAIDHLKFKKWIRGINI